jgi:phosphoglycerate dehydrogenase-like enzyme
MHQLPGKYREILLTAGLEVVYPPKSANIFQGGDLRVLLEGIDGVLAGVEPYSRELIEQTNLRVIARHGVGYDSIDVAAATERGVAVTITPGANEDSVAEQTIAMILAIYRGLISRNREARSGKWSRTALPRLGGRTLGLIGFGRIGKAVARRARALDLKVIVHDPFTSGETAAQNRIELVALETLLTSADIVSLHAPVTADTARLINRHTLAQMKSGAILINTARGGLVDEEALADALKSGSLYAAGLDVFASEPLPADHPLAQLDNVLLCPHMAGIDEESLVAMSSMAAQCLADLLHGRWPEGCVVNDSLRPSWHA